MIFVTTGTQLPFPRLIDAMNELAGALDERIVAQVGPDHGNWPSLECRTHLSPKAFEAHFREARVVVAHAGIGSILSARVFRKPLIIMPRQYALGEHRNDHQIATAREVSARPGLYVAHDQVALRVLLARSDLQKPNAGSGAETRRLIGYLRNYIQNAA
ncbi:MAG: hypothetical protein HKP40_04155 [Litoreibacter sp.]|nr:hypothetical protein [Litoreibacter sp.]